MSRLLRLCALGGALTVLAVGAAQAAPHPGASGRFHRSVCAAQAGKLHCLALEVTTSRGGKPLTTASTPKGYGPSALLGAYNLGSASTAIGAGETVAIVDAYNEPHLTSDLAVYRKQYGLPPADGKSGDPTFTIVNQTGGTSLPRTDSGWGDEEALDVDMVSAICPRCNIKLVEASSATYANLFAAEQTAQKSANVVAVSNSWGGSESSGETAYDQYMVAHPTTVASGDSGYGAEYPATSPNVTTVGGTTLNSASNGRGWTETAWSSGGSGCSAYESQPAFQTSFLPSAGCAKRAEADVAAVGDPNTGVAVYDSCGDAWAFFSPSPCAGSSGWKVFGGTSVAAPIVASVYALANNASPPYAATPYSNYTSSAFNDVISGSNGSCNPGWECAAQRGYDGPTGLGTPNGTGGF